MLHDRSFPRRTDPLGVDNCFPVDHDHLGTNTRTHGESYGKGPNESEIFALFQLSLEMLCIASGDGYFKRVNPAFERVLGYSAQELTSRPFAEFVHPEDQEKTKQELSKLVEGIPSIRFENRYRCRDGTYRWLSWMAMPREDGARIYAVASDVSQQKQVETRVAGERAALSATSQGSHQLYLFG